MRRDAERGRAINAAHATQVRDFSRLRWGTITPTDLDGIVDARGRAWILFEFKYGDSEIPLGQRVALQRLCDDLWAAKKPAILILGIHQNGEGPIACGDATAVRYYCNGRWKEFPRALSCFRAADYYLEKLGLLRVSAA